MHGAARPGAKSQRCFNPDDKVTEAEGEPQLVFTALKLFSASPRHSCSATTCGQMVLVATLVASQMASGDLLIATAPPCDALIAVQEWAEFMKERGVTTVVGLLTK